MKKLIVIAFLFISAFAFGQNAPVNPIQLQQNAMYLEPSTGLRWGYNGAAHGWYRIDTLNNIYISNQFKFDGSLSTQPLQLMLDTMKTGKINYIGFDPVTKSLRYDTTNLARNNLYSGNGTIPVALRTVTIPSGNTLLFKAKLPQDSSYLQINYLGVKVGGLLDADTLNVRHSAAVGGGLSVNGGASFFGGAQIVGGQSLTISNSNDNALNYIITNGNETTAPSSLWLYNLSTGRGIKVIGNNIFDFNGKMFLKDTISGGSAAWGSITGTLSAQSDLNTALSGKQATLVSATNIKTINSATILGSGNIALQTPLTAGTDYLAPTGSAALLTSFPTFNQNTTGTAANVTSTSNSTLVTLSALSLPYSQVTGVPSLTGFVPYTGATTDVVLGAHNISAQSFAVTGTAGAGYVNLPTQSSTPTSPSSGQHLLYTNAAGQFSILGSNGFALGLSRTLLTNSRVYSFPDSTGTVALESRKIPNASLVNSSITINGSPISLGGSVSTPGAYTRQNITSGTSATVTGGNYIVTVDPSTVIATFALTLPVSPSDMDVVQIFFGGTIAKGNVVVSWSVLPNSGQTIQDNNPLIAAVVGDNAYYQYRTATTTWYKIPKNPMRVFNVKWFGAKGDGVTDDRDAIQAANTAAYNYGSGKVIFPAGKYLIHGSVVNSGGTGIGSPNSQIYFPFETTATGYGSRTVTWEGEESPSANVSALGNYSINRSGVIIYSDITGSGTYPSIVGSDAGAATNNFNLVNFVVKNIEFRVKANIAGSGPTMSALNLQNVAFVEIDHVICGLDTSSNLSVSPTAETFGIWMPKSGNGAWCPINNTLVTGYKYGYILTEHSTGNNINAITCEDAFVLPGCYHALYFGRLGAFWCKNTITGPVGTISSPSGNPTTTQLGISQLDIEWQPNTTGNWFDKNFIVLDASNNLFGHIYYHMVKRAVGIDNSGFNKSGGTNLYADPVDNNQFSAAGIVSPFIVGSGTAGGDITIESNNATPHRIKIGPVAFPAGAIDDSGTAALFGSGTTNPASSFDSRGAGGGAGGLTVGFTSASSFANIANVFNNSGTDAGEIYFTGTSYSASPIGANELVIQNFLTAGGVTLSGGGSSGYVRFLVNNSEALRINAGKNWVVSTVTGAANQVPMSNGTTMGWANLSSKAHVIFTPTTGGTVTLTNNFYNIINPAGALVALTVTLPSSPANNDCVFIKFTQNVTTVTYSGGTVVDGITAPTAGGLTVLTYDSGTTSWY